LGKVKKKLRAVEGCRGKRIYSKSEGYDLNERGKEVKGDAISENKEEEVKNRREGKIKTREVTLGTEKRKES